MIQHKCFFGRVDKNTIVRIFGRMLIWLHSST